MHTKAESKSSNAGDVKRQAHEELARTLPQFRHRLAQFTALADLADRGPSDRGRDATADAAFKAVTDALMQAANALNTAGEAVDRAIAMINAEGGARVH